MTYVDYAVETALLGLVAAVVFVILRKTWELYGSADTTTRLESAATPLELEARTEALETGLTFLATVASNGAFLGLAGTVWHIIGALANIRGAGTDISVISGPIATALYATLYGLASAIPASMSYNVFTKRIETLHLRAARKFGGERHA